MSLPVLSGGVKISTVNASVYNNEVAGDILLFPGTQAQNVLIGPSNSTGQSTMLLNSNIARVYTDIDHAGITTTREIQIGISAGAIATGPLTGKYVFNNPAQFNATAVFAGSNTLVASSNLTCSSSNVSFSGSVCFTGSNPVAIGMSNPCQYPLYIATLGKGGVGIYVEGDSVSLSDRRFKTDIRPIPDALNKVNLIGGYTFGWLDRGTDSSRTAGVIAQEVKEVLPEVVREGEDGKMNIAYGNLSALLIQAIKELAAGKQVLSVTTTALNEDFSVELPADHVWTAAFVSGGSQYSRSFAAVGAADATTGRQSAAGRLEVPGTYQLLVL